MSSCHSVAPSLVGSAITLLRLSPPNASPASVVSTPAVPAPSPIGMIPDDLACPVIDRRQERLARDGVVGASPAVSSLHFRSRLATIHSRSSGRSRGEAIGEPEPSLMHRQYDRSAREPGLVHHQREVSVLRIGRDL
jgi:hypothetical protein